MSDAAALAIVETLKHISGILDELADESSEVGHTMEEVSHTMEEGMDSGSRSVNKAKDKTKELQQAFSSARNVMTATIMTLNSLGSIGTIIAQIIGIVQLLADAFRDVATAAHSVIPIIGIFVGLGINIFGRLISILKKILALLKQIALAVLDVAKKVGGVLLSAIKKFAGIFKSLVPSASTLNKIKSFFMRYLLGFRSSYFLIRKIRQAVIDGLKDIAAADETFNEQMTQFTTALNQVKGSLTAAFQPIISFVIPALVRLGNVLADVLVYIAKFNAVLLGQDYYYDYAAAVDDYANSMGGAGRAAKKLQKDLMGFDEINRLSAPNDAGGGGGGLGGTFTKTAVNMEDAASEWAKRIREAWIVDKEAGETFADSLKDLYDVFEDLGQTIGHHINLGLRKFNFKTSVELKETAEKIVTSLAAFINGFVESDTLGDKISGNTLAHNVGLAIANLFNIVFDALHTFATTVHWDKVGKFIGDGIASALLEPDVYYHCRIC